METNRVTFALGIPSTPWLPERVESVQRLKRALGLAQELRSYSEANHEPTAGFRMFTERESNATWSGRMWSWGAETGASHFVTLQDDVVVAPNFWAALRAMVEAVPDQVICLEVIHPAAVALAAEGRRWFTTSDAMVGVAYVVPTPVLREFRPWRAAALRPGAVEAINEDTLLAVFCTVTGRKIWHPIPTIIDHDVSLPSTYGNDAHAARRPPVRWDNAPAVDWSNPPIVTEPPPHLGRFPGWQIPALAYEHVIGVTSTAVARWMADDGRRELRRLEYARRARDPAGEPTRRLYIATPNRGSVHPEYVRSLVTLCATASGVEFTQPTALDSYAQTGADVVRARSRLVRQFLESDATDLLFLDADVSFDVAAIAGMLATGKDFVLCPYPRRQAIHWPRVMAADDRPPEARAYAYAVRTIDGHDGRIEADGTTEIAGSGLGCCLLTRACLMQMTDAYREQLAFDDRFTGHPIPTVALFALTIANRELLSEDHAFCARWRELGGSVWMYLGPGSPVTHHGDHAFRGLVESFGLRREQV